MLDSKGYGPQQHACEHMDARREMYNNYFLATPAHVTETEHANHNCQHNDSVRPAQVEKASASGQKQLSQKLKYDAGRSLVGVQHELLPRLESAWDISRLCLRPANLRWSHCS